MFANGAVTGAFVQAFNHEMHPAGEESARGQSVEFSNLGETLGFADEQFAKFGIKWDPVAGKANALGYVEMRRKKGPAWR